MTAVQLGVSWLDGQAFSQWWEPLPDAEEFHLLSCYVSDAGWARLRKILDARPTLRATLLFSLSGLGRGQDEHFAVKLFDFLEHSTRSGQVTGYLIADMGQLFHPKAHASIARGKTRVVVGSANLTSGGIAGNHEMVSVIDYDLRVYRQFVDAVNRLSLKERAIEVNKTNRPDLLRWLERRPIRRPPANDDELQPAETTPHRGRTQGQLPLPSSHAGQIIGWPVTAGSTLAVIERLVQLGGHLHHVNTPEDLTVSVSLSEFKRAGIIAGIDRQRLASGLVMQEHAALGVALVPDEIRAQLKDLNKALGQLTGRFALATAGRSWLPAAWTTTFFHHWDEVVRSRGLALSQVQPPIVSHLKQLKSDLQQGNAPLLQRLREAIRLQAVGVWNHKSAAHLLEYEPEAYPDRDSAELEQRALDCILERVRTTVGNRLQQDFVLSQFTNVCLPPRFRSCAYDRLDTRDALHVLADWTLAGIDSRVRMDASGVRAPSNGVAQALHRRFQSRAGESIEVYKSALAWRRQVSNPQCDSAEVLDRAWVDFARWFGMREDDLELWLGHAPSWSGGHGEGGKSAVAERRPLREHAEERSDSFRATISDSIVNVASGSMGG